MALRGVNMKTLLLVVALLSPTLASAFSYTMTKADGIGEQLRAEILAIQGIPQTGWTVEQNLRTGTIVVTYFSQTTDLTVPQRTAAQTAIVAHVAGEIEQREADGAAVEWVLNCCRIAAGKPTVRGARR